MISWYCQRCISSKNKELLPRQEIFIRLTLEYFEFRIEWEKSRACRMSRRNGNSPLLGLTGFVLSSLAL